MSLGFSFNITPYNTEEYNASSILVLTPPSGIAPFTTVGVVGSDDRLKNVVAGYEITLMALAGSTMPTRIITALLNPGIETVGLEAVQLNIEGEDAVSTRTATGFANRTFKIVGEYQPTRSVKGGFDG